MGVRDDSGKPMEDRKFHIREDFVAAVCRAVVLLPVLWMMVTGCLLQCCVRCYA